MEIPHSEAAERNKEPILKVLIEIIRPFHRRLLEVGAGTGQHAVYLAPFFPNLDWTPTEQSANLAMLNRRVQEARVPNLTPPFKLQVGQDDFPKLTYDIIFTINTFHIMHWKEVKTFIKLCSGRLQEGGLVVIYGPFNFGGTFTTASNEDFDKTLKEKDPLAGIRGFEDVLKAFEKNDFRFVREYEMPANNSILVFSRLKFERKSKIPRG